MKRKDSSVARSDVGRWVFELIGAFSSMKFDTGWTFVRKAQTLRPGPPVGGH